jgi:hypothetical protein
MTQPPMMISNAVLGVENNENTAMVTPLSSLIPLSTSPQRNLDSQCKDPFRPTAWQELTSIVRKPQRWQVDSLTHSNKTTKIPLKYCQRTTTKGSSPESLQKDSALIKPRLPKGWVYTTEEVNSKVKTEVVDPDQYQTIATPNKCKAADQLDDPYHQHLRASSTTEALPLSHSTSKRTAVKRRLVTSGRTSTHLTPL